MLAQNAKSLGKLKNITVSWYTWVLNKNNPSELLGDNVFRRKKQ